jgi:hypothetical protein
VTPKRRIRLVVEVNLDPVPGWGNVAEDYRALTQRLLDDAIGHYKPTVTLTANDAENEALRAEVASLRAFQLEPRADVLLEIANGDES